jgi:hypothetical protein
MPASNLSSLHLLYCCKKGWVTAAQLIVLLSVRAVSASGISASALECTRGGAESRVSDTTLIHGSPPVSEVSGLVFPAIGPAFGAYSLADCRDPIQSARGIKIGCRPIAAHAANHPSQDFPEIAVERLLVEWLQRPDESIDLNPRWERLAATTDED